MSGVDRSCCELDLYGELQAESHGSRELHVLVGLLVTVTSVGMDASWVPC